jgi:peptidoglycan/LPS O-acetylase OafA/YrhL
MNGHKAIENTRIEFLDKLRAVAVLLVVWGHVFLVGINDPKTVGLWIPSVRQPIFGATSLENIHLYFHIYFSHKIHTNSGGLGVSIFFLISGFVILRTVDYTLPIKFLIRRLFRIFPLLAAVVIVTAVITAIYCAVNELPQPHSISSAISSIFLVNYFTQTLPSVPVLWTLEVEIVFYVLIALVASLVGRITEKYLIFVALMCLLYVAFIKLQFVPSVFGVRVYDGLIHAGTLLVHINFMLVGSMIYRGYVTPNGRRRGLFVAAGIFLLYLVNYRILGSLNQSRSIGANPYESSAALVIFLLALWTNSITPRFSLLQWIGKISYPLYLVHVPLGWAILAMLGGFYWEMNTAALVSTAVVLVVAWLFHVTVELPSQEWGKRVAGYFGGGRTTKGVAAPVRT